jgi:putative ABC transport system permease protein
MRFWNTIRVALRALRRNVMRSILTALGIIIGVGAVITLVAIGGGARAQVEAHIASMGQNLITVSPGSFTSGGMRGGWGSHSTLTIDDARSIEREVDGLVGVSPEVRDRATVQANGLNWSTSVNGQGASFPDIRSWPVEEGAFFTDQDVQTYAKVCVVGKTIVDQLFSGENVIGKNLRIHRTPFRIVGVMSAKGFNYMGTDQDDVVLIPYTSHLKRVSHHPTLGSIITQAKDADSIPRLQLQISDLLQQRRQGREPDFIVRNQQEIAETATATSRTMTLLLGAIAGVSLVVGGIGIMNIMLVSVTERTREIGIRLAVGAHGRDVLLQFLAEAIVLSVLGGALGIAAGVGSSQLVANLNGWPVQVSTTAIVGAVVFSGAVGVFFGFYPARKAAQLDPIDALRYE